MASGPPASPLCGGEQRGYAMAHDLIATRADDLHIDPVGILDVQPCIVALQRCRTALLQIAFDSRPVEGRYPDREMIHDPGRPSVIERHQHVLVAEANDLAWLLLAHHLEAEHPLIEIDGALQVRRVDADVVYCRALEVNVVRSRGGDSTGGEHRKT